MHVFIKCTRVTMGSLRCCRSVSAQPTAVVSGIAYALTVPSWTLQAVERAAPDSASLAAARKLSGPGPWSDVGSTDTLVWGKCQGSGKSPYQVSIDTTGPAYRCSCPSRKFPCKHALALMLRFTDSAGGDSQVPEWAQAAAQRAADRTGRSAGPTKTVDPIARARRVADRRALMSAGIEDFARWLADLVRGGLAEACRQPAAWWDRAAARLVDAQLPGLADRVRRAGFEAADSSSALLDDPTGTDLLTEIGSWWLAVRSWQRFDDLDPATQADLRVVLGWHQTREEVRSHDAISGEWSVLGAHRSEDDGAISQQRTWLRSESTGELVQILDFGVQGRPLPVPQLAGSALSVTLARYPGHRPRRALFTEEPEVRQRPAGLGFPTTLRQAREDMIAVWQHNPWAERLPCVLSGSIGCRPHRPADRGGRTSPRADGYLTDPDGGRVALTDDPLRLLALTGGRPTTIFGELERDRFRPLTVELGDGPVPL